MPTLYNIFSTRSPPVFTITKWDADFNPVASYSITTAADGRTAVCNCPSWPRKRICKHTRMLSIFALAGAIDTQRFYEYERQLWHQPIPTFGESDPTAEKAASLPPQALPTSAKPPFEPPAPAPTLPPNERIRRIR